GRLGAGADRCDQCAAHRIRPHQLAFGACRSGNRQRARTVLPEELLRNSQARRRSAPIRRLIRASIIAMPAHAPRPGGPGPTNRGDVTVDFDKELDARGLSCPLPILKTKKSLNELASGQVLKVVATDPGSVKDFDAFANQTGHALLSSTQQDKEFIFYM